MYLSSHYYDVCLSFLMASQVKVDPRLLFCSRVTLESLDDLVREESLGHR